MRAREFAFEGALTPSIANLVDVLSDLRSRTDQIRVDSLVNLVRKKAGSEMFNIDILADAVDDNQTVKNMVKKIDNDDTGVKYVYLKNLYDSDDDQLFPDPDLNKDAPGKPNSPERTVSAMAKRASKNRT
jgi:hypothetical protein